MKNYTVAFVLVAIVLGAAILATLASSNEEEHEELEYRFIQREHIVVDHTEYFLEENITKYEGSKTCIKCHLEEVVEVFTSAHYQMAAVQRDIEGYTELLYGGKYTYNGFCGAIFWRDKPVNWIGKVSLKIAPPGREELVGKKVSLTGCSMCHGVSMGLPPSQEPTREQLENIDCLACHADPSVYVAGPVGIIKNK